jgi:hypothetical protein
MSEKQKNTQQKITVSIILRCFFGLWGLIIFAILGFIGALFLQNTFEQQRLADLLQVSTYDDIPEMILTQYPIESSTHDDFDALFSSVNGQVSYWCSMGPDSTTECPKNQCSGDYRCEIGGHYVLEIHFTQSGEVTDYHLGEWSDAYSILD